MGTMLIITTLGGAVWGAIWGILDGVAQKKGILTSAFGDPFLSGLIRNFVCGAIGMFIAGAIFGPAATSFLALIPAIVVSVILTNKFRV